MAADWFRPLRNAGLLLTGQTVRGVLSFASVAVAARALGAQDFGILVLVSGTAMTFGQILRLPSWETVVSYGAKPYREGDLAGLRGILAFGVLLDFLTASLALGLLYLLAPFATEWFGLPASYTGTLRAYGWVLPIVALGLTPLGVLRLLDRFDLLARLSPLAALGRLIGGLAILASGMGLTAFLGLWALTAAATRLVRMGFALRELGRRGLLTGSRTPVLSPLRPNRGIWRFVGGSYANNSLNLNKTQVPLLAVGVVLGPPGAGLYRIAVQLANVVIKPASNMLASAIYPDLAHLTAGGQHKERRRMVRRTGRVAGVVGLAVFALLAVAGPTIITWTAGPAYTDAYGTMLLLGLAGVILAWAFPLEPLIVNTGGVGRLAACRALAFGAYLGLLAATTGPYGLLGAGLAALGQTAVMLAFLLLLSRRPLRKHPVQAEQP